MILLSIEIKRHGFMAYSKIRMIVVHIMQHSYWEITYVDRYIDRLKDRKIEIGRQKYRWVD